MSLFGAWMDEKRDLLTGKVRICESDGRGSTSCASGSAGEKRESRILETWVGSCGRKKYSQEAKSQEDEKTDLPAPLHLEIPKEENGQADAQEVHQCRESCLRINAPFMNFKVWGALGTPPCVLTMISKVERAMQRALISLSHVPWMGIHASRMIINVAVLMTVKKAMRRYVYL